MRDGIFDMLTSRLSTAEKVEVFDRQQAEDAVETVAGSESINEDTARIIGQRLNADFVLFGSLTVLGNSISIDAKLVDMSGKRATMTFFDQSQDLGAVITKINQIAADINASLFGQVTVARQAPAPSQPSQPAQPQAQKSDKPDIHAHPEKLLERDIADEEGGSSLMVREDKREIYHKFWRSASYKHLINGLALGDVDGDKKIETVVIAPHAVFIYRSDKGKFLKVQEIAESNTKYLIGVDVADINGNGYDEIFVTSLTNLKNNVSSFVLEYNGQNYQKIVKRSGWFYRVAEFPSRGQILLGQKHRSGKPFSGDIFEMEWQNRGYAPTTQIKTPSSSLMMLKKSKDLSLMGLTIGDVLNNNQESVVAYRPNDRLQIFELNGNEIWTGTERYGGSMMYYAEPRKDLGDVENRLYFPMRIVVWKDQAETSEVIAVINHELTGHRVKYRKFTKAHIESLTWDGLGLAPNWSTRQISGHIRDYAIGDFDNDGKVELVAAVVIKEGEIAFTTPKCTIIAYELKSKES
jgi:TolB-like protein